MNSIELTLKHILDCCYSVANNSDDKLCMNDKDFDNETIDSATEPCRKEVERFSLPSQVAPIHRPQCPAEEVS